MSAKPPIDFEQLAKSPINPESGGYPLSINSKDLMRNFVYATNDYTDIFFKVETKQGRNGHDSRKILLKFPDPPDDGSLYVLGVKSGEFEWIATEDCNV